jgi:hypothetical protein
MRMKFDAEEPDEMDRNNQKMDRSQGAARAISVCILQHSACRILISLAVLY